MDNNSATYRVSAHLVGLVLIAVVCIVTLGAALVRASDIFLILFLGVLFGVFLSRAANMLAAVVPLGYMWNLAATTLVIVGLMASGIALFGLQVDAQLEDARKHAEEGMEQIQKWASKYSTVESVLRSTPFLREVLEEKQKKEQAGEGK